MRTSILVYILFFLPLSSVSFGQSLWLGGGLGYDENRETNLYDLSFKGGVRGTYPLREEPLSSSGLYAAAAWRSGVLVDAGAWFTFLPEENALYGLEAHLGGGLTYASGSVGVALSAGFSYDLTQGVALSFIYTHRPLLLPELKQAFDLSAGIRLDLDEALLGPR